MSRKKLRRKSGGILALVIISMLVMTLLGVAIVMMTQTISTGSRAESATDAGALNVAKIVTRKPKISLADFDTDAYEEDPESGTVSLGNYNGLVAQVLSAALTAEEDPSGEMAEEVQELKLALDKAAGLLTNKLKTASEPKKAFDDICKANILKTGKDRFIERSGDLEWACVNPGEASNIYVDPRTMSPESFAKLQPYLKMDGPRAPDGCYYLKGYVPIKLGNVTVEAIPVMPGQQPHLISNHEFGRGSPPRKGVVPNAFRVTSQAKGSGYRQQSSGTIGSVEPLKGFLLGMPLGYIKVVNLAGELANTGGDELVCDGDNDLFNKEMFSPSRISQANNGVFTTDTAQMNAWVEFNNGRGPDPRTLRFNLANMRAGAVRNQSASPTELAGIRSVLCECTHTMYSNELKGPCLEPANMGTWAANYRRWSVIIPSTQEPLTAFESAKLDVLEGRANFAKRFKNPCYMGMKRQSGMELFTENIVYACPPSPINFSKEGSPGDLLDQFLKRKKLDADAKSFLATLYGNIYKISGASPAEIKAVLKQRKIPMGKTLYLRNFGGALMLTDKPPKKLQNPSGGATLTIAKIEVSGTLLNSPGDALFDDAPFSWNDYIESEVESEVEGSVPMSELTPEQVEQVEKYGASYTQKYTVKEMVKNKAKKEDKMKTMSGSESVAYRQGTGKGGCLGELIFMSNVVPSSLECPN